MVTPPNSAPEIDHQVHAILREMVTNGLPPIVHITNIYGSNIGAVHSAETSNHFSSSEAPTVNPEAPALARGTQVRTPVFRTEQDVEAWFFSLDESQPLTLELRLHVLVMAVFSGNSIDFIETLKGTLRQSLMSQDTQQSPAVPFHHTTSTVLAETGTHVTTLKQERGYAQVYEFVEPLFQISALRFLSASPDLRPFRQTLSLWLEQHCLASDSHLAREGVTLFERTRIQCAIGLGEFAKHNYPHFYRRFIEPWSLTWISQGVHQLNALTWMLFQLATDPRYTDAVYTMVMTWAEIDHAHIMRQVAEPQRDTYMTYLSEASRIYTAIYVIISLGMLDLKRSLPIITQLAGLNIPQSRVMLLSSLSSLYSLSDYAVALLDLFVEWQRYPVSDPVNVSRAEVGVLYFLMLVGGKVTDQAAPLPQSAPNQPLERMTRQNQTPQDLIHYDIWEVIQRNKARGLPHPQGSLEFMIKCALRHTDTAVTDHMIVLIEQWMREGDLRPDLTPVIFFILREVKRDRYGYRIMMRLCASRQFTHSPMAAALLRA